MRCVSYLTHFPFLLEHTNDILPDLSERLATELKYHVNKLLGMLGQCQPVRYHTYLFESIASTRGTIRRI